MDILEQIMEMQGQGLSDEEIYLKLRNMGISPKEIYDATNQAKVKSAVSAENGGNGFPEQEISPEDFVPKASVMNQEQQQESYPPTPQRDYSQQESYSSKESPVASQTPEQVYQDNYYSQAPQGYSEQDYYTPQGIVDTATISEIAGQIVSEKIEELKKETGDISVFKTRIDEKVSDIDERLRRIEGVIDKLQQAVVGKIGEFGENAALIHRDLDNLHGTVSKLMNPLVDNYNELKKLNEK